MNVVDFNKLEFLVEELVKKVDLISDLNRREYVHKEFYSVKDLATLTGKTEDTVRKKYIKSNVINAHIPRGSKAYVIPRSEFERVKTIVKTYGTWALSK